MPNSSGLVNCRNRGGALAPICVAVFGLLLQFAVPVRGASAPELPLFLDDVESQFEALALRPDGLAFDIGDSPDPRLCKHYQGLARVNGPDGTPYLLVARSGNQPGGFGNISCPLEDDDPGNLLVVRLGSRGHDGERLRSNRLARDSDILDDPNLLGTPPDPRDRVIKTIYFNGNGWPDYAHPGGMQLVGDVLALSIEHPYESGLPETAILFIDVSDPERPELLSMAALPDPSDSFSAGLVGITPFRAENGRCCRYVMIAAGKQNTDVRFYRSRITDGETGVTDLKSPALAWDETARFSEQQIEDCLNADNPYYPTFRIDWHTGSGDAHQMLNFVRQGGIDGPLFLIGGRNTTPLPSGDDMIDLYRIHLQDSGVPESCFIEHVRSTHVTSKPFIGGGDSANLAAASGVYVTPSGELMVYASEYENDGPLTFLPDGSFGKRAVRFAEYRHEDMARWDSPSMRPSISVTPEAQVDEGSSIDLEANVAPASTQAWIELYEDDGAGGALPGLFDSDRWVDVDYPDRDADDFDNFGKLNFNNNAGSWRWFAPEGCTIYANDYTIANDDFPGPDTLALVGSGYVEVETDLDGIGYDDDVGGVTFGADCQAYYAAPIEIVWDLDTDGEFETTGSPVRFDAGQLDGPSGKSVRVRAEHPTDTTPLGHSATRKVDVYIRNVAPVIASLSLQDSLGNPIGGEVPVSLVGLPVVAAAKFTDPGVADHQQAQIEWGDGVVEPDSAFDAFADAYGGSTGSLSQAHTYLEPGTFEVRLAVTDDDGGSSAASQVLAVLSVADALEVGVDSLTELAAGAPSDDIFALLQDAIESLLGRHGSLAANGAIDALEGGSAVDAVSHLIRALGQLAEAVDLGAGNIGPVEGLLALTAESLAKTALSEYVAAHERPNRGEAVKIEAIQSLIDEGHNLLLAGGFEDACVRFRQAIAIAGG